MGPKICKKYKYAIRPTTPYHEKRYGGMIKDVYVDVHEGMQFITKFDSKIQQLFTDNPTKVCKLYATYVCEFGKFVNVKAAKQADWYITYESDEVVDESFQKETKYIDKIILEV